MKMTMRTYFQNFKLMSSVALVSLLGVLILALPSSVSAAAKDDVCAGIGSFEAGGSKCNDNEGPSVNKIIKVVINIISVIAGVIAVIMIIVAGLKYITSSGDPNNITSAKNTLLYAIVGLVVVAVAQVVVNYVLTKSIKA